MQQGYTKYCEWDSRDKKHHYVRKDWPQRHTFSPGKMNISYEPLVNPRDVYLPPPHIKLGLMKIFVKALGTDGQAFTYLRNKFPKLSEAEVKQGIFIGPQIRDIMQDPDFHGSLSDTENAGWNVFKSVFTNFLGNHKAEKQREIVSEMLKCFQVMKRNMSLNLHFLDSHLNLFP
jgi:hypothetical protein